MYVARQADCSPLKRSFEITLEYRYRCPSETTYHDCHGQAVNKLSLQIPLASPAKRRSISKLSRTDMLMPSTEVMSAAYPSFMSVFQSEEPSTSEDAGTVAVSETAHTTGLHDLLSNKSAPQETLHSLPLPLQHRGSIASLASASTQSSPTTTNSTFDSPLMADPSPSSSPESPTGALSLSPFKAAMSATDAPDAPPLINQNSNQDDSFAIPQIQQPAHVRSQSPGAGTRNVKNLSLNMDVVPAIRPATSLGIESSQLFSAPTSPMKEPLRTGRRKPTNLTIRTPGFQQLAFNHNISDVPPTPSNRPNLHHYQSSPSLVSLASPRIAPAGGLHLPIPSVRHSKAISQSSLPSQSITSSLPNLREEDDHSLQKTQETQERGYPGGPVQIYDCGVYLYLEPTRDEAGRFDTVINVAKEVKNPYAEKLTEDNSVMSIWRTTSDKTRVVEPQTAISEKSFKSAFEWPQPGELGTPTTPRPLSSINKEPEYIHVRWDHNSEILDDLYPLCQIIDERVQAGKKVLIHCQLGVSRSASLVIAYGLYKGYQSDFHSMYMVVKQRSQWVGPNMSLIYQLTDFRGKVSRGDYHSGGRAPPEIWFQSGVHSSDNLQTPRITPKMERTAITDDMPVETIPAPPPEFTAPMAPPLRLNKELPPVPLFPKGAVAEVPKVNLIGAPRQGDDNTSRSPPSSTEPSSPPPTQNEVERTAKRVAPRPLPFRLRPEFQAPAPIPPYNPRHPERPGLNFTQSSSHMDLAIQDVPTTPFLFSPRASEFITTPFGILGAGDLNTGSLHTNRVPSVPLTFSAVRHKPQDSRTAIGEADPRSPHQKDESGEMFPSIDDVL